MQLNKINFLVSFYSMGIPGHLLTHSKASKLSHVRALAALTFLLPAACAPTVKLGSPAVGLPAAYETVPAQQDAVALDRWWLAFADSQLSSLIETALVRSTDARTAYFRLSEARAIRSANRAQRLPTGSLSGSVKTQGGRQFEGTDLLGQTARSDSQSASFSPSWELDLFGRLAAIGREADATYRAAYFDYHAARMALAADVATALFEARSLAMQQENALQTLRIASDLVEASTLGRDAGLIAAADTARLETDKANAQAEATRLETQLRNAKRSLLVLTGDPTAPTDTLIIDARLAPPPAVPATLPSSLLVRRPDILSAEQKLEAAAQTVRIDRLALFPRISLQGSATLSRTTGPFGGTSGLWSIAGSLSLPILDRPRLLAQMRVSQARGEQAVVAYEAAVQAAFRDADNALASTVADRARLQLLTLAEERALFAFRAARSGFRAGLTDLTTLLQSERTWRQTRDALTVARAQALTGTVDTYRALGGGWDPTTISQALPQPPAPLAPILQKAQ